MIKKPMNPTFAQTTRQLLAQLQANMIDPIDMAHLNDINKINKINKMPHINNGNSTPGSFQSGPAIDAHKPPPACAREDKSICVALSGASGFLGLHLIHELTHNPAYRRVRQIKCFVRSVDKFMQKKKEFSLDFSMDKISFHEAYTDESLGGVDYFFHCAAELNNLASARVLWGSNVALTSHILEHMPSTTQFCYVSTLSVFASSNLQGLHPERLIEPSDSHLIYGGYAQTKYMAELQVAGHKEKNLSRDRVAIIRLGLLTPSYHNPAAQSHEFLSLFSNLIKNLGVYPEGYEEAYVDMTPVDLAAPQILRLVLAHDNMDEQVQINKSRKVAVHHIASQKPVSLSHLLGELQVKPVSLKEWREKTAPLKKIEKILLDYAFFKSMSLEKYPHYRNIDLFQTTHHHWGGDIDNAAHLRKYMDFIGKGNPLLNFAIKKIN